MALILPSPLSVQGNLDKEILPLSSDAILNSGETGSIVAVNTTSGNVTITLPPIGEVSSSDGFYFYLACGSNVLEIVPGSGDTIEGNSIGYYIAETNAVVALIMQNNQWVAKKTSGSWTFATTTTTSGTTTTSTS